MLFLRLLDSFLTAIMLNFKIFDGNLTPLMLVFIVSKLLFYCLAFLIFLLCLHEASYLEPGHT